MSFDAKKLQDSIRAAAMEQARQAVSDGAYDIECPHCKQTVTLPAGQHPCPKCGQTIDLKLNINF